MVVDEVRTAEEMTMVKTLAGGPRSQQASALYGERFRAHQTMAPTNEQGVDRETHGVVKQPGFRGQRVPDIALEPARATLSAPLGRILRGRIELIRFRAMDRLYDLGVRVRRNEVSASSNAPPARSSVHRSVLPLWPRPSLTKGMSHETV